MYQFTAPHIFKAIENAVTPAQRKFELILHPVPEKPAKTGVKANDLDEAGAGDRSARRRNEGAVRADLGHAASRRPIRTACFASAYHIKVAVRDGAAFWLSSGNWQSSNQPDVHPFVDNPKPLPAGFQRKYNRDYHAIIKNEKLASIYEFYIKRDFELSAAQAGRRQLCRARPSRPEPDLFVAEEAARTRRVRRTAAIVPAAAAEPRGQRAAAADAGQLCGERAEADPVGHRRASGSRTSTSTSAAPTTTSPNSSCWSERSRTRSTRSSTCASSAAT